MRQSHTGSGEASMVAGLTTCPRCCVQTEPDDQFCQDCGFHLAAGKKLKPASPVELKAVLTCLNCGAQHEEATEFCESCGSRMSDMGVYTTTVRAISSGASSEQHSSAAVRLASSLRAPGAQATRSAGSTDAGAAQPNIHPAIEARNQRWRASMLDSGGSAAKLQALAGRAPTTPRAKWPSFGVAEFLQALGRIALLPGVTRGALDLVTGFVLLAFFISLVWWMANLEGLRSAANPQGGLMKARAALGAGRFDQSVKLMEKVTADRDGALSTEERRLFNEALYKRAKFRAGKSDHKGAVADLLRITPNFAEYAESREKLAEYSKLVDATAPPSDQKPEPKPKSSTSETRPAGSVQSDPAEAAPPATEQPAADSAASAADPSTQTNYTDADVVRYHKLLEGFFTTARGRANQPGETPEFEIGAGPVAANPEPPTLHEWLQQGKPDF